MSRTLFFSLLIVCCSAVRSPLIHAQTPTIGLYADPAATDMALFPEEPFGLFPIYVVVLNAPYISAVDFSAPMPSCYPGAIFAGEASPFPLYIGNSQTGISIAFGTCIASPVHVLTIYLYTMQSPTDYCAYPVLPSPNAASGKIEMVDCANNLIYGIGLTSYFYYNAPPLVWALNPPDGATAEPLDTQLVWWVERRSHGLGVIWCDVYFGTTSDPPLVAQYLDQYQYDPGPLQPETTYYWKLRVVDTDSEAVTTDVWSFTTEGPIPVGRTTWGGIKSLYE